MYFKALSAVLSFVLLMPSSPVMNSINNLNIQGVSFGQYTEINDVEFTFESSSSDVDVNGNAVNASHRQNFAANGINFTCALWVNNGTPNTETYESECSRYVMSGSISNASAAGYFTEAQYNTNLNNITALISETYQGARYDFAGYDYLNVHFNDNKAHTGTFQINAINQENQAAYISENENVTVIGQNVYFYNVSNFNLRRAFQVTNSSTLTHTLDTVTVANLQETTSESLADLIKFFMGYTAPERMNALGFWKGYGGYNYYGNSGDYPSLLFETFPAKTSFFQESKLTTNKGKLYIAFYHNRGTNSVFSPSNIKLHYENSNIPSNAIDVSVSGSAGMWCYRVITLTPNNDVYSGSKTFSIEFQGVSNYNNLQIVPLYVGSGVDLTDEEKTRFGIVPDKEQNAIDGLNESLNNFNSTFDNVNSNENNAINDFNENINNLNFNAPTGESFVSSANFFKRIFTDFVGSTPLFTPIAVALMITLTMLILGAL